MLFNREGNHVANGNVGMDGRQAALHIDQWLAARLPETQDHEAVFETLRLQMQKVEHAWRSRSPLAAQIIDEIGRSGSMEDIVRQLSRLADHIRATEGKSGADTGGNMSSLEQRPRAVRTLIRL
ncbi:hypothetical protein [Mesorhizobium sp. ANAO-SY3R2]|uniref:hypothetical protein n=1 Tax=Mesorhizobium sp. ANAO-SY3R2 TaxID=3166644 RepID=UPI00366E90BA